MPIRLAVAGLTHGHVWGLLEQPSAPRWSSSGCARRSGCRRRPYRSSPPRLQWRNP